MDQEEVLFDRRAGDRRAADRRGTPGRRQADWAAALPPVSRLIPAAVVVLVSLVDLFVAQATSYGGWGFLVVVSAIPIAAFALMAPTRWRWHLAGVWFAVGIYVTAAVVHIVYLLAR
jgi:hypothetical protein